MKRNHLIVLLSASVIVVGGCGSDSKDPVSAATDDPPPPAFTHRVLFSLTEGSISPIYVSDASGANRQQLTSGRTDHQPQGSPDGTAIIFSRVDGSRADLWRMAADGTGAVKLTDAPGNHSDAQWSPDGTRILFKSDRDGQTEIYVMNSDGSGQSRLTDNPALDAQPSWSPDGSRIIWASNRDAGNTPLNWEIYAMDSDGANTVRLTQHENLDAMPSWSPDGESIVFASNRHDATADTEIYVMSSTGAAVRTLSSRGFFPKWSPDGSRIAFTQLEGSMLQAFVMRANGTVPINVSNGAIGNDSVGWLFAE